MTVDALIAKLIAHIRSVWYRGNERGYYRDERALCQAIARYGYECHNRGWDLQPEFICRDMVMLLNQVKSSFDRSKYLPIYLEAAIDRHIRLRAEELQAEARKIAPKVQKLVASIRSVECRRITDTEILATVYRDLKRQSKRRRTGPRSKQLSLI